MADALDSKSSDRKVVGVQVPPPVLFFHRRSSVPHNLQRLIRKYIFPGTQDLRCVFPGKRLSASSSSTPPIPKGLRSGPHA